MKYRSTFRALPLFMAIARLITNNLHAGQAAVSFDWTVVWGGGAGQGVYGWQFTPRTTLQITALGLYDSRLPTEGGVPGDGFYEAHTIALWQVTAPSTPIRTAVIPAGTVAPLDRGFRYITTAPLTLSAGVDYVIAAQYTETSIYTEDWTTGTVNNPTFVLSVSPEIQFGGYRATAGPSLIFPTLYEPGVEYGFGPNFTYTLVPEPGALALWVLGAMVLRLATTVVRQRGTGSVVE